MSPRPAPIILLIEPDERQRNAIRAALRAEGFDVYSTADAEAGFSVLLDLHPCACIVLSAAQSGLSARDFIDRARSYVRFHRIPLVVTGDAPRGIGLGGHIAVARPVVAQHLVHAVRRALLSVGSDAMRDAE